MPKHPHQVKTIPTIEGSNRRNRLDLAYFWATHQGAEIDLVLVRGGELLGVECKRTDAPRMTASIRSALRDLKLARVVVLYPGAKRYPLGDRVEAVPLQTLGTAEKVFEECVR